MNSDNQRPRPASAGGRRVPLALSRCCSAAWVRVWMSLMRTPPRRIKAIVQRLGPAQTAETLRHKGPTNGARSRTRLGLPTSSFAVCGCPAAIQRSSGLDCQYSGGLSASRRRLPCRIRPPSDGGCPALPPGPDRRPPGTLGRRGSRPPPSGCLSLRLPSRVAKVWSARAGPPTDQNPASG